jgi:hypothetical protein
MRAGGTEERKCKRYLKTQLAERDEGEGISRKAG